MNDDKEILKVSCDKCKEILEGTFKDLFGDLPSLMLIPKMKCKCGGSLCLEMTGKYVE